MIILIVGKLIVEYVYISFLIHAMKNIYIAYQPSKYFSEENGPMASE